MKIFLLYSCSVYSCHLFLIYSASVRSIAFLSFIVPIFAWNVPLVSLIFLKRDLYSFPFCCFPLFNLHWSLRKSFLSLLAILLNSAFKWVYLSFSPFPFTSFLFITICKPPQITILPFCISFLGVWFSYGPIWPPYRWVALLKELPWCLSGKESPCQCRRHRFDSWVKKIPLKRKWQPTPLLLDLVWWLRC